MVEIHTEILRNEMICYLVSAFKYYSKTNKKGRRVCETEWQSIANYLSWIIFTWRYIRLVTLNCYIFENFHNSFFFMLTSTLNFLEECQARSPVCKLNSIPTVHTGHHAKVEFSLKVVLRSSRSYLQGPDNLKNPYVTFFFVVCLFLLRCQGEILVNQCLLVNWRLFVVLSHLVWKENGMAAIILQLSGPNINVTALRSASVSQPAASAV